VLLLAEDRAATKIAKKTKGSPEGWHAHLGTLMDHLEGREPRPFWSWIVKMKAQYEKRSAS